MSIKMIALVAATVAATASIASADANSFGYGETLDSSSSLDLGNVRAAAMGVVEIYDFRAGTQGALLGSTTVHAGANQDVRVNVGQKPLSDVLAVLKVNGEIVSVKDYDIRSN
jgi:hypothetical protein